MNTKKLARAAAVGAVTSVTALLLGSTPAVAQEDDSFPNYALGLAASGLLKLDAMPYVESLGDLVTDQLTGLGDVLGEHEDALSLGVLTTEAEAGRALSTVTELNVLELLSADAVKTWCDDGEGGLEILGGSVLGMGLPDTPASNTRLDLSPLLSVVLNKQARNADGSLTVEGIEVTLLPNATDPNAALSEEELAALPGLSTLLGTPLNLGANTVGGVLDSINGALGTDIELGSPLQSITIGAVNCTDGGGSGDDEGDGSGDEGEGDGDDEGDESGNGPDNSNLPAAPAPSVVAAALPVTG